MGYNEKMLIVYLVPLQLTLKFLGIYNLVQLKPLQHIINISKANTFACYLQPTLLYI